jgi:hypothetical protein
LGSLDALLESVQGGDLVCADLRTLDPASREAIARAADLVESPVPRVLAIARLGERRLQDGSVDNIDSLVPLYLRAPAIGPQR